MLYSFIVILCIAVAGDLLCNTETNITSAKSIGSGRKRKRNEENWAANVRKKQRNGGRSYLPTAKKLVPEKVFEQVESCCPKRCFQDIKQADQESVFKSFWKGAADYNLQNYFLNGLMIRRPMNAVEDGVIAWDYYFRYGCTNTPVCQGFLCKLLQIEKGRFATIQNKLEKDLALKDTRGQHDRHSTKLTKEMKQKIQSHCESIPHSKSHFTNSNLNHFKNPELTLVKLHELFCLHYNSETGLSGIPISIQQYSDYFNYNLNLSFKLPRTDVCNDCFKYEKEMETPESVSHELSIGNYKKLKESMIRDKDVLCLEFDFGQNLAVPKLPVSQQFHLRLLWLHIFNVHVLKEGNRSDMYLFMEGTLKKGANTGCNFLLDSIKRELALDHYNKIYLFSDSCGGQNKNCHMVCFLSVLSQISQTGIHHVFPVRGHSYCSCDRNFGLYVSETNRMERIETPEDYFKLIESARTPPSTIIKDSDIIVREFESLFQEKCNVPKNLEMMKSCKITYYPNGCVALCDEYNSQSRDFSFKTSLHKLDDLNGAKRALPIGIKEEKIDYVRKLTPSMDPANRASMETFLSDALVKEPKKNGVKVEKVAERLLNEKRGVSKKERAVKSAKKASNPKKAQRKTEKIASNPKKCSNKSEKKDVK